MYFRNYGFTKTWLGKYLKSVVYHNPSTSNIINALKHCSNQHSGTFTIFIDHCGNANHAKS